jgi:hypothetical protein
MLFWPPQVWGPPEEGREGDRPRPSLIVVVFWIACVFAFVGAVTVAVYLLFFKS